MTEMTTEIIGYIAAFLTTGAFIPQAIKTHRSKDTQSISLVMYSMFVTGVGLWMIYGFMIDSKPMLTANFITLCLSSYILKLKITNVIQGKEKS